MEDSRVTEILAVLARGSGEQVTLLHGLCAACLSALPVSGVGVTLMTADGPTGVVLAVTDERARQLEELQFALDEGPCVEASDSGRPVARDDLPAMRASWPAFTKQLQGLGFHSAQALPMRLRTETIGALNLFRLEPGRLSQDDLGIGQALADVATVGLIQERAIAASELLATQLQTALHSRVRLEQAKGVLAERTGLPMDQAFQLMRDYARSNNRRLGDIAAQITDGLLDDKILRTGRRSGPGTPLPT